MDFGICVAAKVDYITHAENLGYFHAWVADSQMIWSDCYAVLALAAEQTRRIKLGTGASVSGTRIAPVTANSIATITRLAPGRAFLGIDAARVDRRLNNFYTCSLTAVVVLKPSESVTSERVLNECGAFAIGSLHYAYDKVRQMGGAPPAHLRRRQQIAKAEAVAIHAFANGDRYVMAEHRLGPAEGVKLAIFAARIDRCWQLGQQRGIVMTTTKCRRQLFRIDAGQHCA